MMRRPRSSPCTSARPKTSTATRPCCTRSSPPSACPWPSTAMASTSSSALIGTGPSQGKGRIERLWNTLQDRLVSELRLRQIASRAAANAFLPEFLADFNPRFARPAAAAPAWRRPPRDLDGLLSCRYQRCVARDNTVRLGPRVVQISPGPAGRSYAGRRVEVRELFDGRVLVFAADHLIAETAAPADWTGLNRRHQDFQVSSLLACSLRLLNDLVARGLAQNVTRSCGRLHPVSRSE